MKPNSPSTMVYFYFLLIALIFASSIQAQESESMSSKAQIPLELPQFRGNIRVEGSSYPSPLESAPQLSKSLVTTVGIQYQGSKQATFKNSFDLVAGKYLDLGGSFFGVQEIYSTHQKLLKNTQVTVGRKLENWSQVDSDWQLGLWEPKFNLDPLRPINQGLTGVFVKYGTDDHEILFFGTPIFIPTMDPEIKEKDGTLVSDSRWYKAPSSSSMIMDKDTKLVYSLQIPDLEKLVAKPGMGVRYKFGGKDLGFWGGLSYGYKPINSLLLKYDARLYPPISAAEVAVGPDVGYHHIYGADLGYFLANGQLTISYLHDEPARVSPEYSPSTDWVMQQPGSLRIVGLHYDTNLKLFFDEEIGVAFDYIRVSEVLTYDIDSDGEDRGSLFPYRTRYTNALSIKTAIPGSLFGKNVISTLRYMREFDQMGTILGAEVAFYPAKSWYVLLGVDALAVDDSSDNNTDPRFINQFRANDRIYGGFNYVF